MAKFMLYTDKNNDFRWKFSASDDRIVARSSEGFRAKDDCIKSLELLKAEIGGATVDPTVQTMPAKQFGRPAQALAPAQAPAPAVASVPVTVGADVAVKLPVVTQN